MAKPVVSRRGQRNAPRCSAALNSLIQSDRIYPAQPSPPEAARGFCYSERAHLDVLIHGIAICDEHGQRIDPLDFYAEPQGQNQ